MSISVIVKIVWFMFELKNLKLFNLTAFVTLF